MALVLLTHLVEFFFTVNLQWFADVLRLDLLRIRHENFSLQMMDVLNAWYQFPRGFSQKNSEEGLACLCRTVRQSIQLLLRKPPPRVTRVLVLQPVIL